MSHKNFLGADLLTLPRPHSTAASPTLDTLVKRLFLFNLCALAWKIWYDSFAKGCSAFETRNLELPPFWRTVEKQPPCMGTGQCHAELTHSSHSCFQRRTNQHRRRRRERAKKIQSALPFSTHTLLPSTVFFFLAITFPCRIACGHICFSISICQSFLCFSCSFTEFEFTVPYDTAQFSSVSTVRVRFSSVVNL